MIRKFSLIGSSSGLGLATKELLYPQRHEIITTSRATFEATDPAADLLGDQKRREAAAERHSLKTIGQPEHVAELVSYRLSDAARSTTGQILCPDGGLSSVGLF
ncbi:MAG: NAD(P)-dependent dehydrogenase (short-subunit alcohol dehydrogenase family) [Akkermansiaceae bacterium]|jgi:NAD(P)-dependent dehydrogenase (short-subunit alcohol dehydrogenase family)